MKQCKTRVLPKRGTRVRPGLKSDNDLENVHNAIQTRKSST